MFFVFGGSFCWLLGSVFEVLLGLRLFLGDGFCLGLFLMSSF